MKFVRDVARGEDFVEGQGAGIETEIILIAAIEIDFEAGEMSGARERKRAIAFPKGWVGRGAKDGPEDARARRGGRNTGEEIWEFVNERGAVGADGGKELRMAEREMERAVAAHGDAGNSAIGATRMNAVVAFNEGKEFFQQKVFVTILAIARIDIETRATAWRGDEELFQLAFFPEILDEIPGAGVNEHLFVIAEAVEEIEDREPARFVGVKVRRKKDAIRNGAAEDFAG
jgi:hypothetical protein